MLIRIEMPIIHQIPHIFFPTCVCLVNILANMIMLSASKSNGSILLYYLEFHGFCQQNAIKNPQIPFGPTDGF